MGRLCPDGMCVFLSPTVVPTLLCVVKDMLTVLGGGLNREVVLHA